MGLKIWFRVLGIFGGFCFFFLGWIRWDGFVELICLDVFFLNGCVLDVFFFLMDLLDGLIECFFFFFNGFLDGFVDV